MVGKLIKHEFIRTRGLIATILGAAALLVAVGTITAAINWPFFAQLGMMMAVLGSFAVLPAMQLLLAADYWRTSYRATGYLTHSLPVKGSTIYWAKFCWAAIVSLATVVWMLLLAPFTASAMTGATPLAALRQMFDGLGLALEILPGWSLPPLALLLLLTLLLPIAQLFFAASVGSERRLNRLGAAGPVIVFFLLYAVMQVVLLIFMVAIPIGIQVDGGTGLVTANYLEMILTNTDPGSIPVGFVPGFVLAAVVLVWRTVVSWNRKVSLV